MRLYSSLLLLLLGAAPSVLHAGVMVIDFETFPDATPIPDSTILTTQFPGLTFSNTIILSAGISLNEFEVPPHSGQNVASDNGGPMSITFDNPILSFAGYFTYYEPLTIQAFDATGALVASANSAFSINVGCDPGPFCLGDPGSSPNEFIQVVFANGISSVTITGDPAGGSFALDDATTMTQSSAPEPNHTIPLVFLTSLILLRLAVLQKHNPLKHPCLTNPSSSQL